MCVLDFQISQAFKLFGMQEIDNSFVAVTVGESREDDIQQVIDMATNAGAQCQEFQLISDFNSIAEIKKVDP